MELVYLSIAGYSQATPFDDQSLTLKQNYIEPYS